MHTMNSLEIISDFISDQPRAALAKLEKSAASGPDPALLSALRIGIHAPGQNMLYYHKLRNLWQNWSKPPLKPNVNKRDILLLADFTADGLEPLLSIFCAAYGIEARVTIPPFDSVEQLALGTAGQSVPIGSETIVVILLSEQWLSRYMGGSALVGPDGIRRAQEMIRTVLDGVRSKSPGQILIANFPGRAYPMPGATSSLGDLMGWNLALGTMNLWLASQVSSNTHIIDLAQALFLAGGRSVLGQTSYFRAKIPYEPMGAVAAAREISSAVANICGKSHRAIVSDWDNTLWGGIVGEVGFFGVECGVESPDGLAYCRVQEYLKALKDFGILLAAVSRNAPETANIFNENTDLPLSLTDFASLQVGYTPKSQSIAKVSSDLGFGPEFMVFIDDSPFELIESIQMHPYLDVLLAGPDPEQTLSRLSLSRFCNAVALSDADTKRTEAAQSLKLQREAVAKFSSIEDFLKSIDINLEVASLDSHNLERVVQMFQKTNQFNLTTRRHGETALKEMLNNGGKIGVFSYADTFGTQGIISVVALMPQDGALLIDSWLMSCRVLNRTVEEAVFSWIAAQADGKPVIGEYLPTEKNILVKDLFERMGFENTGQVSANGGYVWRYDSEGRKPLPPHYLTLQINQEKLEGLST